MKHIFAVAALTASILSIALPASADHDSHGGAGPVNNNWVIINAGAETTLTPEVALAIKGVWAKEMSVSNHRLFEGAIWEPYTTSRSWTLLPGSGVRTVYVRFRDEYGYALPEGQHDSIELLSAEISREALIAQIQNLQHQVIALLQKLLATLKEQSN